MKQTHVFYNPDDGGIIDVIREIERPLDPDAIGMYGGKTLAETRKEYPNAVAVDWDEAERRQEEIDRKPVEEIDEARYIDMLEVLPPVGWIIRGDIESFKMVERWRGRMTSIFAKVGSRYFHMQDVYTMPHDEIIQKCLEYMEKAKS